MTYSTGNDERDAMILRALQTAQACNDPISVESLSAAGHLPPDFDLDGDELDGMLSNLPAPKAPPAPLVIDTLPDGRKLAPRQAELDDSPTTPVDCAPRAAETAPPSDTALPDMPQGTYSIDAGIRPETVAPKIAEAEARRALDVANARLAKARDQMAIARGVVKERRSDLAGAIRDWQILGESPTDGLSKEAREARELRAHLAAQNEQRAARVATRNIAAKTFVQRHMQHGPSRGAYSRQTAALAGYVNHDPRRGPVPKLPSER